MCPMQTFISAARQFRLFSMLEHLLLDVGNFSEQLVYQLDSETQERLIERYYGLDDAFCREVVGKKLREGNRIL